MSKQKIKKKYRKPFKYFENVSINKRGHFFQLYKLKTSNFFCSTFLQGERILLVFGRNPLNNHLCGLAAYSEEDGSTLRRIINVDESNYDSCNPCK